MRVGVVGAGYWGSKHVRVLHTIDDVSSVVVIDPDDDRRAALTRAHRGLRGHADLRRALDDVDALIIATPPSTHHTLALTAIEAGKHVLVEKPMAVNVHQAHRMLEAASRAGVVLMSGHTFEYHGAVLRLRDLMASGHLGRIHHLDSARLNLGLYQHDVNVVWDLAPHDVSICNLLLGDIPTSVAVWARACASGALEDVAVLRLDYADIGVSATIRVSWLDPCKVRRTTVLGSRMMAVYDDLNHDERLKLYDRGVELGPRETGSPCQPVSYRYGDTVAPHLDLPEPLFEEDRDFVRCALQGTEPRAAATKGLAVVAVLDAANRSIAEGREVEVAGHLWTDGSRAVTA